MLDEDCVAALPLGMRRTLMMRTSSTGWARACEVRRTPEGLEVIGWISELEDPWDDSPLERARTWFGVHHPEGGVRLLGTSSRRWRWPSHRRR